MAIRLKCPTCGTIVKPGNRPAGSVAACPNCRSPMRVPAMPSAPADTDPAAKAVTIEEVDTVDNTPRFSDFIPTNPHVRQGILIALATAAMGFAGWWVFQLVRANWPLFTIDPATMTIIGEGITAAVVGLALIYFVCFWPVKQALKVSRKLGPERKPVGHAVVGGVSWGIIFVILSIPISQFVPVFGGVMEKAMAKPLSPARLAGIPIHVFVFGLLGILFGALGGAVSGMIATPKPPTPVPQESDTRERDH
ncbi:MAG: hypothetical protein IT428_06195 [Planctomycetaceae bacterium]|nr:hypothetical protein [Planctomycetaceae bacterium]